MAKIAILGAGVMGSAMAVPIAYGGHAIDLVGTPLDTSIIEAVAAGRPHPGLRVDLGPKVVAHPWAAFPEVMRGDPDLLVLGVSSAGVDWAIEQITAVLRQPVPILMITKGLIGTAEGVGVLPDLIARQLESRTGVATPVMAIGGPCIAGELAAGRDTNVVVTGTDDALLCRTLALLDAPFYHAQRSSDVVGVEVCAAFKNFFALGVGAAASLAERLGPAANGAAAHNVVATLFTRAVQEMAILVQAIGGESATAFSLAGVGDLYVTCQAGRNSRMGRLLGQGVVYSRAKSETMPDDTVEGAQLAISLGPTLDAMLSRAVLPGDRLPLTKAILAAVCRDEPLDILSEALLTF